MFHNVIPMEGPAYHRMVEILVVSSGHQPDFRIRKVFMNIDAIVRMIVDKHKPFIVFQQILDQFGFGLGRMAIVLNQSRTMG